MDTIKDPDGEGSNHSQGVLTVGRIQGDRGRDGESGGTGDGMEGPGARGKKWRVRGPRGMGWRVPGARGNSGRR